MSGVGESGDNFGVKDSVDKRGNSENETYERTGSTNIKKSARGANWGADENKRAERADECRSRNEKG